MRRRRNFFRTETRSSARSRSGPRAAPADLPETASRETGPRSGPSAPARRSSAPAARNGSGTETGHRQQHGPPRSRRDQDPAPDTISSPGRDTRSRPGPAPRTRSPAEISRTQEGRPPSVGQDPARHPPQAPPQVRETARRPGSAAGPDDQRHGISARTRPTETDETGSSSGKRTGNGGKGRKKAGNGTGGWYTGNRERLRACISSRIGPGTVRRTAAGRAAGPPPTESWPGRVFAAPE